MKKRDKEKQREREKEEGWTHFWFGTGKMAQAILEGAILKKISLGQIGLFSPSGSYSFDGAKSFNQENLEKECCFKKTKILWLAMKPKDLPRASLFFNSWEAEATFSVLAQTPLSVLKKFCKAPLVRAMPNILSRKGLGTTVLFSEEKKALKMAVDFFSSIGSVTVVEEEEQLDTLVPLNGCGPALVSYLLQGLEESYLELKSPYVKKLLLETAKNTVEYLQAEENYEDLIKSVASKGGITENILKSWDEVHLKELLRKGLQCL